MRITEFGIRNFRSIENILIKFPKNKPLILFGPNNAGKTNILTALNIALGESYPTYREMDESDSFFRDKKNHPKYPFTANLTEHIIPPSVEVLLMRFLLHIITITAKQPKIFSTMENLIDFTSLMNNGRNVKQYI